mmetsp:Transcript_85773/g.136237  ORF Transcript_85773/g.136237 Transcript_85773/m.136237 type:complete len:203 (-) Transcript_85773:60-668(-)
MWGHGGGAQAGVEELVWGWTFDWTPRKPSDSSWHSVCFPHFVQVFPPVPPGVQSSSRVQSSPAAMGPAKPRHLLTRKGCELDATEVGAVPTDCSKHEDYQLDASTNQGHAELDRVPCSASSAKAWPWCTYQRAGPVPGSFGSCETWSCCYISMPAIVHALHHVAAKSYRLFRNGSTSSPTKLLMCDKLIDIDAEMQLETRES